MAEPEGPTLLIRLIDSAERIITRNAALGSEFAALRAAVDTMADSAHWPRCVGDEAVMLATALGNRNESSGDLARRWEMIAGALLPMVRDALGRAIEERRDVASRSDPDSQPQYRGGRSR